MIFNWLLGNIFCSLTAVTFLMFMNRLCFAHCLSDHWVPDFWTNCLLMVFTTDHWPPWSYTKHSTEMSVHLYSAISRCEVLNSTFLARAYNKLCFTEGCHETSGRVRKSDATSGLSLMCCIFTLLLESPLYSWTLKICVKWPPLTNSLEIQKLH